MIGLPIAPTMAQVQAYLAAQSFLFSGIINVMDPIFGVVSDPGVDTWTNLQNAINAARDTGAEAVLPDKALYCSKPVVFYNNMKVRGFGRFASFIVNTGVGNGAIITNPMNGSGYGRTILEDFCITGNNIANVNGALELQAGGFAYYTFRRLSLGGNHKYGLIVDQAEISWFDDLIIENGGTTDTETVNIWVVNGEDRRAGTAQGFTNVIRFSKLQLNNAKYGIVDDGGNLHIYEGGNLNGNANPCRFAGITSLKVVGLSLESQLATGTWNMLFDDRSLSGVNVGPVKGGIISGNTFTANMAATQAMLRSTSSADDVFHEGLEVVGNNFFNVLGRTGAIDLTKFKGCRFGPNADDSPDFHYVGTHNDANANELWQQPANCAGSAERVISRAGVPTKILGGVTIGDPTTYPSLLYRTAELEGSVFIGGFTVAAGTWHDLGVCTVTGADPLKSDMPIDPIAQTLHMQGCFTRATVTANNTVHGWIYNPTAAAVTFVAGTWNFGVVKRT